MPPRPRRRTGLIFGTRYAHSVRLVVTPHFSYDALFLPQYRWSQADWADFERANPDVVAQLVAPERGLTLVRPDPAQPADPVVLQLPADAAASAAARAWMSATFPAIFRALEPRFFDPHAMMAGVLDDLHRKGTLGWQSDGAGGGSLTRSDGSCRFCTNDRWQLPGEYRYRKNLEPAPPPGFLERVAAQLISGEPK